MDSSLRTIIISAVGVGAGLLLWSKHRANTVIAQKKKANKGEPPRTPDELGAIPVILTNKKGVEIYARRWDPEGMDPKGVLILIHGDLLWSQFYKDVATTLASRGYVVYAYDMVGYGVSGIAQGIERHVDNFEDYLSDLGLVIDFAKSLKPGLPCFLLGEDLGATVAVAYSMTEAGAEKISGLALASPMLEVPQLEGSISSVASSMFPLSLGPKWKFSYTFEDLYSDPDVINTARQAFEEQNPVTNRKLTELQRLCKQVKDNAEKVTLPFLLMHGDKDVRNSPKLSDDFQRNAGSKAIFFRPYPDYKHGLFSDSQHSGFPISDVQAWLSRQARS